VSPPRSISSSSWSTPADVGLLVFVTQTPDYPLPGNSMLAQQRLGLPAATYLLDLNQVAPAMCTACNAGRIDVGRGR